MNAPKPLPTSPAARKDIPVITGVLDYFPLAIAEVARVSKAGNDQHNPGQPLHWAREKSTDHANCIGRHLMERGTIDELDGMRHSAKMAWRALALLQTELEMAAGYDAAAEAQAAKDAEKAAAETKQQPGLFDHILKSYDVLMSQHVPPGRIFITPKDAQSLGFTKGGSIGPGYPRSATPK